MKKFILLLLTLTTCFVSCEKDDICEESISKTPRLIVSFYDNSNPTVLKNVTDLKVTAEGKSESLTFNNVSKIELPLKTSDDITKYQMIMNASDLTKQTTDIVAFQYKRKDVYISRACGFKTLFDFNDTTIIPVLINNNPSTISGNWIKNTAVSQPNVNDENETHVKIYL